MAGDLQNLGRIREAREALAEALRILEARVGGEHPQVAAVLVATASLEIALGNSEEGRRLAERGLAMAERLHGPGHRVVALGRLNRAEALFDLGRVEEAVAEGRAARDLLVGLHGEDTEMTLDANRFYATFLVGAGRPAEAEEVLARTVARAEALPAGNVILPNALQVMADARLARGDAAGAEAAIRRALELEEAIWPEGHPDLANALATLGEALRRQGDPEAARRAADRAAALLAASEVVPPAMRRRLDELEARLASGP
jgi:tetratricopeptide (TPR) repeat protein